jgi:hypothetical protein
VGAVYWEEVEVVARSPHEESGRWEKDEEGGAGRGGRRNTKAMESCGSPG